MASKDIKLKFIKMFDIIKKHWLTEMTEDDKLCALVRICKDLGIDYKIVKSIIIDTDMNKNLIRVQDYYMEKEIYDEYVNNKNQLHTD